jgi:hypothetical protein
VVVPYLKDSLRWRIQTMQYAFSFVSCRFRPLTPFDLILD